MLRAKVALRAHIASLAQCPSVAQGVGESGRPMSSPGSGLLALRQENGVGHLGVNTWHVAFPPPFHLALPFMNLFAGGLSSCVGSDLS